MHIYANTHVNICANVHININIYANLNNLLSPYDVICTGLHK